MNPFNPQRYGAHRVFHDGELKAHRRFGVVDQAQEMSEVITRRISVGVQRFLEAQPFFFLSLSHPSGRVDGDIVVPVTDSAGRTLPLLVIDDAQTIRFAWALAADFSSPVGAGLLFVDFERGVRYRINGRLRRCRNDDPSDNSNDSPSDPSARAPWPASVPVVALTVEQAYANCGARVIRMARAADQCPSF